MARDFDGTDDQLAFGSDASIDDFTALSIAMWLRHDGSGSNLALIEKVTAAVDAGWLMILNQGGFFVQLARVYTGSLANWNTTAGEVVDAARHHVVVVQDGTTADPVMYVDGTAQTINVATAPSGTPVADAAVTLLAGESLIGLTDLNGVIESLAYDNTAWTAAQANRHRWWGRKGGTVKLQHPFTTTKTANEGSATADAAPTGTTVIGFATPVQRPGVAMLGAGVGL